LVTRSALARHTTPKVLRYDEVVHGCDLGALAVGAGALRGVVAHLITADSFLARNLSSCDQVHFNVYDVAADTGVETNTVVRADNEIMREVSLRMVSTVRGDGSSPSSSALQARMLR
jgi:hypothetical protein